MKYLVSSIITILAITLFAFKGTDEGVKSQSEHMKSLKEGKYITYEVEESNGHTSLYNITEEYPLEVTSIEPEKNFPNKHFYLKIKLGRSINEVPKAHLPDHFAFPISYPVRYYEGNAKMQKEIGYTPRKFSRNKLKSSGTYTYIVLDGVIYSVTYLDELDEIKVWHIFVHEDFAKKEEKTEDSSKKKKKMSLKERMKALKNSLGDAGASKLHEMKAYDKVKEYYKAAYKKQQEVIPVWEKSAEGQKYKAIVEGKGAKMDAVINQQNSMLIKNSTGRDIYIYRSDSNEGSVMGAGVTLNFPCGVELYYDFTGKRFYYPNKVIRISRAGVYDKCADKMGGKAYEVK
ncbi:hypothetical protein WAF17_15855 [Bernardetia sp. ABR2-2B]|uniref:hypothetical protein n=1 Tax=Bernardetia sp. ABR2-2B TaxID=3127472 RepID=UPI0030CB7DD0